MNFGFKIINNILMLPKFIKPRFKHINCIRQQNNMIRYTVPNVKCPFSKIILETSFFNLILNYFLDQPWFMTKMEFCALVWNSAGGGKLWALIISQQLYARPVSMYSIRCHTGQVEKFLLMKFSTVSVTLAHDVDSIFTLLKQNFFPLANAIWWRNGL